MSASFEHSAMKSSFSLSSLRSAPAPPARADHLERPYHSLTKKRKEPCREAWRRSWGSAASGSAGDDLWPLLQHHYDYIMDNHLIDTCKVSYCNTRSRVARSGAGAGARRPVAAPATTCGRCCSTTTTTSWTTTSSTPARLATVIRGAVSRGVAQELALGGQWQRRRRPVAAAAAPLRLHHGQPSHRHLQG
ncbi:uncharacterized protein LOC134667581 [Cydia fagiglandana]|uniref:uncharacterized protein LOC134667581 n=1 Tax=Cydia fagiglandana TaxID=1458189 RepID=UPI002FEE0AB7